MGAPPDADQMYTMMSAPEFQTTMNEMLQNPQMLDYIIESNPALRATPGARELMQSAEFRRMMTNPEMIRHASMAQQEAARASNAAAAFPTPGVTDTTPTTPGSTAPQQQAPQSLPAMPANPFAAIFGQPAGMRAQPPLPGNPYANLANIFGHAGGGFTAAGFPNNA